MPSTQIYKLKNSELAFALFRSEVLALLFGTLMSAILKQLAFCTVFANFLENKSRSEQKEYTTFINSSWGISERKMREINFSSMCHIFVLSRGLRGHSLWNERRMSCSNDNNWMNGREMFRQMTNDKQTSKHKLGNRTNRWKKVQTYARCPNSKKQPKQQR